MKKYIQYLASELLFLSLSFANKLLPKKTNKIVLYGRKMLNDNLEAMLIHLIENDYNTKYEVYCLLANYESYTKYKKQNINFVNKPLITILHLLTASIIFHTHTLSIAAFKPCHNQKIFNLWHGSALKRIGNYTTSKKKPKGALSDSNILVASDFFKPIAMENYGHDENQLFIGGNPRNDLLFSKKDCFKLLSINKFFYNKIVLFMPTFRSSNAINKIDSSIEFPIITQDNINRLNQFLTEKKILLIIKPHPYQNDIDFLNIKLSNIIKYTNDELINLDVCLYELLGQVDALLTDYSSVFFDFLLTQKPIGFVIDDIEDYADRRGFTVDNPLNLMPGEKIYNIEDLSIFLEGLLINTDSYIDERKKINSLTNKYHDGQNCSRILDFLGIKK